MQRQGQLQQQQHMLDFQQQRQSFIEALQDKERSIRKLAEQVDRMNEENERLRQNLNEVITQRDRLQIKLQADPLYNIFTQQPNLLLNNRSQALPTYSQLEQKLSIYNQKLSANDHEIAMLKNRLIQKDKVIKNDLKQLNSLRQSQGTLVRQSMYLNSQLELKQNQITRLNNVLYMAELRSSKLLDQLKDVRMDLIKKGNNDYIYIQKLATKINNLTQEWTTLSQKALKQQQQQHTLPLQVVKQLTKLNQHQKVIMQQMGKQCDLRNNQITHLRKDIAYLKGQQNQNNIIQYLSVQHSVREMIGTSQIRQKKYTQMIEKLKEMVEKLNKSYQENQILRKTLASYKNEIQKSKQSKEQYQALKQQYENYKLLYEQAKFQIQRFQENMIPILIENQVFHQLMFQTQGPRVYKDKIQMQVKKYHERQRQRQGQFKWANIEELINMNKKLMQRIKSK